MDTRKKVITTTLAEDFKSIGVPLDEGEQANLSGSLNEDQQFDEEFPPKKNGDDEDDDKKKCPKCKKGMKNGKCECGYSMKEDMDDAIDGPLVTRELLERVSNLPFENFEENDFDELLDALKLKALPEEDTELRGLAEEIVKKILNEKVGILKRKFKKHSMGKIRVRQCEPGKRTDPSDPSGKRCIRSAQAVGGIGKLTREGRKKRLWGKGGKGAKSKRITGIWAPRRKKSRSEGLISPFAAELAALTEGAVEVSENVRDEIIGRVSRVFRLLHEEFSDASVSEVYENVFEDLHEAWEAGRLDEEVMESGDFIAEMKPALSLIMKSLDRLDKIDGGELEGN